MKRIAVLIVVAMLMVAPVTASAGGIWSMIKNSGEETRPTKTVVIEVSGVNIRAYIFDVPELQMKCINLWGEDTQQLECKTYDEIINAEAAVKAAEAK